jgi:hypothetical protein
LIIIQDVCGYAVTLDASYPVTFGEHNSLICLAAFSLGVCFLDFIDRVFVTVVLYIWLSITNETVKLMGLDGDPALSADIDLFFLFVRVNGMC